MMTLQQSETWLLNAANIIRGPVDPSDYKAYISPMLFFKRISDVCDEEYTYMDIIKVFAYNLKKYRTKIGLTQETFAEKAGLHRTYISALECEKRSIALDNVQ